MLHSIVPAICILCSFLVYWSEMEHSLTDEQRGDIERNKDVAAMSYLWILSVVVLYARRDSPFIQYHAKQGLWLFVLSIPVWLIPRVGQYLEFFVLAGMVIGFLNAAQGRYHDVPVVGALAKGTLTLLDIWKKLVAVVLHAAGVLKQGVKTRKENEDSSAQSPDATPS
jgi:uncharacterized membrane protein